MPRSPEAITPSWLTTVLQSEGLLEQDKAVSSVKVKMVGEGEKGLMSSLGFLTLTFDGETQCPATMAAKSALANFESRVLCKLTGLVEREAGFLKLMQRAGKEQIFRSPKLYHAEVDSGTQDFLFLMEDLRPAKPGSQIQGSSDREAMAILGLLARLHAAYWGEENWARIGDAVPSIVPPNHKSQAFVSVYRLKTKPNQAQ